MPFYARSDIFARSRALVTNWPAYLVNVSFFALLLQGNGSGRDIPWWLWLVLISVLLLLLLVSLVHQIGSGETLTKPDDNGTVPVVVEEAVDLSAPERETATREVADEIAVVASEPGDGGLAEIEEEFKAQEAAPQDDLKRIEGIGPKIAMILNEDGIVTFSGLASTQEDHLRQLLDEAGIRSAYVGTWSKQAQLAEAGQWAELETYQSNLKVSRKK